MKIRRIVCIAAALCMLMTAAAFADSTPVQAPANIAQKAVRPTGWDVEKRNGSAIYTNIGNLFDGDWSTLMEGTFWTAQAENNTPDITVYFQNETIKDLWLRNGFHGKNYLKCARIRQLNVTVWVGDTAYGPYQFNNLTDSIDTSEHTRSMYEGYQLLSLPQKFENVTKIDLTIANRYKGNDESAQFHIVTADLIFLPDTIENLYGSGIFNIPTKTPAPTKAPTATPAPTAIPVPTSIPYPTATPNPYNPSGAAFDISQGSVRPYQFTVEERADGPIGKNIGNLFDGSADTFMSFTFWSTQAKNDTPDISLDFYNATIKDVWLRNGWAGENYKDYARILFLKVTVWSGGVAYGPYDFNNLIDSIDSTERSESMYDGYQRLSLPMQFHNVTRVDLFIKGRYLGNVEATQYGIRTGDLIFLPDSLTNMYGSWIFNNNNYYNPTVPPVYVTPPPTAVPYVTPPPAAASVEVLALDNLATRSGPGTNYNELGTYSVQGQTVKALSKAYDERNGIWWIQVELSYGEDLRRVYTGLKRLSMDVNLVPTEESQGSYAVKRSVYPYYGPGYKYTLYNKQVPAGTTGTVWMREDSYVLFEYFDASLQMNCRVWIPEGSLEEDAGNG